MVPSDRLLQKVIGRLPPATTLGRVLRSNSFFQQNYGGELSHADRQDSPRCHLATIQVTVSHWHGDHATTRSLRESYHPIVTRCWLACGFSYQNILVWTVAGFPLKGLKDAFLDLRQH